MLIEIMVIIACIAIVGGVLGTYIYKRAKGIPTGECAECRKGTKKMLKKYKKMYGENKKA